MDEKARRGEENLIETADLYNLIKGNHIIITFEHEIENDWFILQTAISPIINRVCILRQPCYCYFSPKMFFIGFPLSLMSFWDENLFKLLFMFNLFYDIFYKASDYTLSFIFRSLFSRTTMASL